MAGTCRCKMVPGGRNTHVNVEQEGAFVTVAAEVSERATLAAAVQVRAMEARLVLVGCLPAPRASSYPVPQLTSE